MSTIAAAGSIPSPAVHTNNTWGIWAAFATLAAVCVAPTPEGLPIAGQYMIGMLLFAVILWMTEAVDYAVSAVIITALMAFLLGTAPSVAKPDATLGTAAALTLALGAFANTALALVAAALFISAGMTSPGSTSASRCGSCPGWARARAASSSVRSWSGSCCRSSSRAPPRASRAWCRS